MTRFDLTLGRSLWEHGVVTHEIASRLGTTANHVHNLAQRHGWPKRRATGGHNKLVGERESAKRMWDAGLPRATIAAQIRISRDTVSKWARLDGWLPRTGYASRPILANREPYQVDAHGEKVSLPPAVVRYACQGCGHKAASPHGHAGCIQGEAA